jgi:hypothetical protein
MTVSSTRLDTNRAGTAEALFAWAKNRPSIFGCCSPGVAISDACNGGATFMAFLAAEFGEDIHKRLLQDTASTFDAAFERQTKPYRAPELLDKFRTWLSSTAKQ